MAIMQSQNKDESEIYSQGFFAEIFPVGHSCALTTLDDICGTDLASDLSSTTYFLFRVTLSVSENK